MSAAKGVKKSIHGAVFGLVDGDISGGLTNQQSLKHTLEWIRICGQPARWEALLKSLFQPDVRGGYRGGL